MPLINAQLASTCVVLGGGPPRVSTYTTVISVKVKIMPNSSATVRIGRSSGSVTSRHSRHQPTPSTCTASRISGEIEVRPAMIMTVDIGSIRQICTSTTENI